MLSMTATTRAGRPWRRTVAAAVALVIAAGSASAQVAHQAPAGPPATDVWMGTRALARPAESPLLDAGRAAARALAAERTQASSAPRGGSCAKRVVVFALLGAGVALVSAGVLLAATGGSDDTNGILTRWGLAGTAAGAGVGALACLAP
jgi:hypothetical protein